MNAPEIQSEAFQQASQRSERIRIVGLLYVVGALVAVVTIRALVTETDLLLEGLILLAGMAAYEALMLRWVGNAVREGRFLPFRVWVLNVFVESLFPTIALIVLTGSRLVGPYRALVAPAVLVYFFFIVLSTLRLNPKLSVLTGVFSAVGYLAAVGHTYREYPVAEAAATYPMAFYVTYAAFILLGGVIAGVVASQIRGHVAAALHEAELQSQVQQLEHDLDIARSIQQGLLPKAPPELTGFQVAGWNKPADQTGGDYFDWQELADGKVAISLADATGHGIGPALIMAVCRAYARSGFSADGDAPVVMDRLNKLLVKDLPAERFVTYVAALLDPAAASLQLVSAGHGPILHYRAATREFREYKPQGIPLGLIAGVGYGPAEQIPLEPGDLLVLMTDGFFEWENLAGEEFGVERLKEVLQHSADLTPDEMIQRLYEAVRQFTAGAKQADDLTAVVLKRTLN